jgi:opacity protein-like surface antigen
MKNKKLALVVLVFILAKVNAQTHTNKLNKLKPDLFATTFLGGSFLGKEFKKFTKNGLYAATGIEAQYLKNYFVRLGYENIIYPFSNLKVENGFNIKNIGNRLLLGGIMDFGYRFELGRLTSYAFTGIGVSALSSGVTRLDINTSNISTSSITRIYAGIRFGGGFEIDIKKRFTPVIELSYFNYPNKTFINETKITGVNVSLGFKTKISKN